MTEQRRSYAGQHVYVGIDVHKDTYTVTCVHHKRIVKTATVQADPAGLAASLPRWFPGATLWSAYEAGFSAFVLHRGQPCLYRRRGQRQSQDGPPGRQKTGL